MSTEAMKVALEAYLQAGIGNSTDFVLQKEAHDLAVEAPAKQEQGEPMVLIQSHSDGFWCADLTCNKCYSADFRFKHASSPQRTWVGLTSEDYNEIFEKARTGEHAVQLAEAKLRGNNT